MITNERQYRITRSEAQNFERALAALSKEDSVRKDVHPRLIQAEREALASQLEGLREELREYEELKSAESPIISTSSFDQFADGLIKARIAAGLSQKDLADRLDLKEQQIQRYESERYARASFRRLQEVANAIGVRVRNDILLPMQVSGVEGLVRKLGQVGIDRAFLFHRLLPSSDAAVMRGEVASEDESLASKAGLVLERIFGWSQENIFGASPLATPKFAAAEARFKVPAGRTRAGVSLYAAYANYLSVIALTGCRDLPKRPIPTDPVKLRDEIERKYGEFNLKTSLNFVWDLGIPVLPLKSQGTFHGACWRYDGRNALVLKQSSLFESRWIFDLFHELFHAAQRPELETLELIEEDETSDARRSSDEEVAASQFAGDVMLRGRADELAQSCVKAAKGSIERLKGVVPSVAREARVSTGALANYMAFRLSWQGLAWWGAAANMQRGDNDPWLTARDVFFQRFPFAFDSELDRQLLDRALQEEALS